MFDFIATMMIVMPIGFGIFLLIQSIKEENAVSILLSMILIAIGSGTFLIVKHLSDIHLEMKSQNIRLESIEQKLR